jgi:hypothetical protein
MSFLSERERARNRGALFRTLQRLPDEEFEAFVKAERRRRRQASWLIRGERDRWSYRRGLTRNDQIKIMRAAETTWRKRP